jgi:hypothetical protein
VRWRCLRWRTQLVPQRRRLRVSQCREHTLMDADSRCAR